MSKSKAPALAKGLDIIDLIRANDSLSFLELQELTEDNPASLSRYIHTLIEKNYLFKNQFQKYELGLKLIGLKDNKSIWPRLQKKCNPFIKKINKKYGVTVLLLAYNGDTFVAIDKVIALNNLGMMEKNTVGQNNLSTIWTNLYYTELNGDSIDTFINNHIPSNNKPQTKPNVEEIMANIIDKGHLMHYSNSNEIYRIGIPIRYQGQVIATIGMGTFVNQLESAATNSLIEETLAFAEHLSLNL